MPHRVSLSHTYDDEHRARLVERAVAVEVGQIADERSRARVSRSGETVRVRVDADDLVALRAGLNTWSRLVGVAEEAVERGSRR